MQVDQIRRSRAQNHMTGSQIHLPCHATPYLVLSLFAVVGGTGECIS